MTLPDALAESHRTTVWAEIRVQTGSVRYVDLEGDMPRDDRLEAGDIAVIEPGVEHYVEPSTDARFYVQFFREPDAAIVPGVEPVENLDRSGPWAHRGRDLDTIENHRHLHDTAPFTPELFDRWLQVFHDTVDEGWTGPNATIANKRATGMAFAMAQRFLGHGVWHPSET